MLPQQWSNPDYCYLEPASRVKPEQPHQMAVSTNHNLGGCVIQLTSYLIDMKNYRGFQGYSPFHSKICHQNHQSLATAHIAPPRNLYYNQLYFLLQLQSTFELNTSKSRTLSCHHKILSHICFIN